MGLEAFFFATFGVWAGQTIIRFGFVYVFLLVLRLIRGALVIGFLETVRMSLGVFCSRRE